MLLTQGLEHHKTCNVISELEPRHLSVDDFAHRSLDVSVILVHREAKLTTIQDAEGPSTAHRLSLSAVFSSQNQSSALARSVERVEIHEHHLQFGALSCDDAEGFP